jgi:hypothetical protein
MNFDRSVVSALATIAVLAWSCTDALSQTNQNTRHGTPNRPASGTFGTDWAKPYPQTGGMIYMDPRTQNNGPAVPSTRRAACPSGHVFNSATGICH